MTIDSRLQRANDLIDKIHETEKQLNDFKYALDAAALYALSVNDYENDRDWTEKRKLARRLYWEALYFEEDDIKEFYNVSSIEELIQCVVGSITKTYYCPCCGIGMKVEVESRSDLERLEHQHYADNPCDDCIALKRHIEHLKQMPYKEYLKTDEWQITRQCFLEKADNKCQLCNTEKYLHVHHRTYENLGEEEDKDCIVLCRGCHAKFHDIAVAESAR